RGSPRGAQKSVACGLPRRHGVERLRLARCSQQNHRDTMNLGETKRACAVSGCRPFGSLAENSRPGLFTVALAVAAAEKAVAARAADSGFPRCVRSSAAASATATVFSHPTRHRDRTSLIPGPSVAK